MAPCEVIISKKLNELESEIEFLEEHHVSHPRAASVRSKVTFLQSLLAAESDAASTGAAARLSRVVGRLSALDGPKTECFEHRKNSKPVLDIKPVLLLKNLGELESMANALSMDSPQPLCHPNSSKIMSKIAFTKSLLAAEGPNEELSSIGPRLVAVEEAFGHLDATPPSCSHTSSCHTEEVEEDEEAMTPWLVALKKKIEDFEQGISGDSYDDARRNIGFLKSLLAAEMKWKVGEKEEDFESIVKRFSSIESEYADRNPIFFNEDDANGGSVSPPCSCTSSCFDGGEEDKKVGEEEEEDIVPDANEAEEVCSPETMVVMEGKSETSNSREVSYGKRRFGNLRAIGSTVGVFVVVAATIGVLVGSFFVEVKPIYLVPT